MYTTKRKTVLVLFSLSITALFLSGCWDRTEINDLAIITAAGLDITEDQKIELSVNIYVTKPSGSQQMGAMSSDGGGAVQSIVQSAAGLTMADAVSELQQKLPRKVFWGQDEVFIFGERLAKQGIVEPMEYMTRHPAPRERASVFVSKGSAKEVLQLQPTIERNVGEVLREMAKSRTGLHITMKELAQMMAGKAKAAVIPWVEIPRNQARNQDGQKAIPFINGTAVLKNGKMVGTMNDIATRGIMWLRNEVNQATVTVSPKNTNGYVSFQLIRSHTELVPHIKGDSWSITVKIDTEDDIVENTTDLNLMEPEYIQQMETELGNDIENRVKMALTQAQKKMNADIFNFADAFYRKYPKEWNQVKDRWDEIYPKVEVNLEKNAKVTRPGLTGKSLLKPEQK